MGYEKINRITKKKDGIYISSKSSNDSMPFRSWKCDFLTEEYDNNGDEGLIKALFSLFTDNCEPYGWHKSIEPFRCILSDNYTPYKKAYKDYLNKCDAAWNELTWDDRDTRWTNPHSPAMQKYLADEKIRKAEYIEDLYSLYNDWMFENKGIIIY